MRRDDAAYLNVNAAQRPDDTITHHRPSYRICSTIAAHCRSCGCRLPTHVGEGVLAGTPAVIASIDVATRLVDASEQVTVGPSSLQARHGTLSIRIGVVLTLRSTVALIALSSGCLDPVPLLAVFPGTGNRCRAWHRVVAPTRAAPLAQRRSLCAAATAPARSATGATALRDVRRKSRTVVPTSLDPLARALAEPAGFSGTERATMGSCRCNYARGLQCVDDERVFDRPFRRAPELARAACHRERSERIWMSETFW